MPRRSLAALATIVPKAAPPQAYPPASLTEAQLRCWRLLVEAMPAGWFGPAQTQLLVQLVRHSVRCDELEEMIAKTDPDDLDRLEQLCRLSLAESAHVNALSRSLRLTLQARMKPDVASHRVARDGGGPRGVEALFAARRARDAGLDD